VRAREVRQGLPAVQVALDRSGTSTKAMPTCAAALVGHSQRARSARAAAKDRRGIIRTLLQLALPCDVMTLPRLTAFAHRTFILAPPIPPWPAPAAWPLRNLARSQLGFAAHAPPVRRHSGAM
jgi:hypothetical protein